MKHSRDLVCVWRRRQLVECAGLPTCKRSFGGNKTLRGERTGSALPCEHTFVATCRKVNAALTRESYAVCTRCNFAQLLKRKKNAAFDRRLASGGNTRWTRNPATSCFSRASSRINQPPRHRQSAFAAVAATCFPGGLEGPAAIPLDAASRGEWCVRAKLELGPFPRGGKAPTLTSRPHFRRLAENEVELRKTGPFPGGRGGPTATGVSERHLVRTSDALNCGRSSLTTAPSRVAGGRLLALDFFSSSLSLSLFISPCTFLFLKSYLKVRAVPRSSRKIRK